MVIRLAPRQSWRTWVWLACCAWLAVFLIGCSVETKYQIINFFFDGMQDPNAPVQPVPGNNQTPGSVGASVMASRHKPFVDKNCDACHAKRAGTNEWDLIAIRPGLCIECHQPVTGQYAVMHTPVSGGVCLWCHAAHESREPKLLRESSPKLCYQCHEQTLLSTETKEHADFRVVCLNCHTGHGGPDRRMLRAAPIQPETRPVRRRGGVL